MDYEMSFAVLSEESIEVMIELPSGEACRFIAPASLFKEGSRWRTDQESGNAVLAWVLDNKPAVVEWSLKHGVAVRVPGAGDGSKH